MNCVDGVEKFVGVHRLRETSEELSQMDEVKVQEDVLVHLQDTCNHNVSVRSNWI